jgi:acyl-CoA synthetase (AMP-forming)/AMP-acid ligase II
LAQIQRQLPDRFEFLDVLPRTSSGKFFKAKLREQYGTSDQ